MKKLVIVINGSGGAGKDTICDIVGKHYETMNVSSIDPIKKIAMENGWDGGKDEKSRKFLADLKQLFVEFNDLPLKYLLSRHEEFQRSAAEVMFVHIREPEEIAKFQKAVPGGCVTLLVRGRDGARRVWNNTADDAVENFAYDFEYENKKELEEVEEDFLRFLRAEIDRPE